MTSLTCTSRGVEIDVLQGAAVHSALADSDFARCWSDLFTRCPWSTAYQTVDYAKAWYHCYADLYEPLVVRGVGSDESVAGVLALAVSKQNGELVPMGVDHADYAAWISSSQWSGQFFDAALDTLSTQFAGCSLILGYLPPGAPIEWVRAGSRWASRCVVVDAKRPLMELKPDAIRGSLRKRNNRNRLSRLRRMGELQFHRLTDVDSLSLMLDDIAPHYDLRRMALYGKQPLRTDARKRAFYLELMHSGRMHATVSTIQGNFMAAMIGVCDRETFSLDLICHSPAYAAQSPGKLHLLALAEQLVADGYRYIDLTPGNNWWKDRSATSYDTVYEVTIAFNRHGSLRDKAKVLARHHARRAVKNLFSWIKLEPRLVRDRIRQLTDQGPRAIVGNSVKAIAHSLSRGDSLKHCPLGHVDSSAISHRLVGKKDAVEDLFLFQSSSARLNRAFLRRAYDRLCAGEHVFTHTEGDRLLGLCWVKQASRRERGDKGGRLVVYDSCFHPLADRQQSCRAIARAIAVTLGSQLLDEPLDLSVSPSDHELIVAFDELQREQHAEATNATPRCVPGP